MANTKNVLPFKRTMDLNELAKELTSKDLDLQVYQVRLEAISNAANVLKEARHKAHLTQNELSRRSGVPQSTISKLENAPLIRNDASHAPDGPGIAHLAMLISHCGFRLSVSYG